MNSATEQAYGYVRRFGMSDEKILISGEKEDLSDRLNFMIDTEVQDILKVSFFLVF